MAEVALKCKCGSDWLEERIGANFYQPSGKDRGTPQRLRPVSGAKRVKYICLDCGLEVYESPETKPVEKAEGAEGETHPVE